MKKLFTLITLIAAGLFALPSHAYDRYVATMEIPSVVVTSAVNATTNTTNTTLNITGLDSSSVYVVDGRVRYTPSVASTDLQIAVDGGASISGNVYLSNAGNTTNLTTTLTLGTELDTGSLPVWQSSDCTIGGYVTGTTSLQVEITTDQSGNLSILPGSYLRVYRGNQNDNAD